MIRLTIKEIVWDSFNTDHIKKHNVSIDEITITGRNFIYHRKTYHNRYLAIGRSGKRIITIIIKRIATGKYYLITARDSNKKERNHVYEKEKNKNSSI